VSPKRRPSFLEQLHSSDLKFSEFPLDQFMRKPGIGFEPAGIGEQVEDRQRDPATRRVSRAFSEFF